MRLAVSNIVFRDASLCDFLDATASCDCVQGCELAANKIWEEPLDATAAQRRELRAALERAGLALTGLHALFFHRQDLRLFELGAAGMRDYLAYLLGSAELCAELGGGLMVLGSPGSRRLPPGGLGPLEAELERGLGELAGRLERLGVVLALEFLPPDSTDFLVSVAETQAWVDRIGSKSVGLHIDVSAFTCCDTDPAADPAQLEPVHVHVNGQGLAPVGPQDGTDHVRMAGWLAATGYEGWHTLEVLGPPEADIGWLSRQAAQVHEYYGA